MDDSLFKSLGIGSNRIDGKTFSNSIFENGFETKNDLLFYNCTFENIVALENFNIREFAFIKCTFKQFFTLSNSQFFFLTFTDCQFSENAHIISCNTKSYFSLRDIKATNINISGDFLHLQTVSSSIENLSLDVINAENKYRDSSIEFLADNFIGKLNIKSPAVYSDISFRKCEITTIHLEGTFYNKIFFSDKIKSENIIIESSVFYSRIDIEDGMFAYISLYRSTFHNLIRISDLNYTNNSDKYLTIKDLTLHSCNFEKDVSLNIQDIKYVNLSHNNFEHTLSLSNNSNENDSEIVISLEGINQGNIVIEKVSADITMSGINFGNIYCRDLKLSSLVLMDFQNVGIISFTNILSGNHFVIQDSISGNLNFLNTDINLFKEIVFANSYLEGANFNKYPKKILSSSSNPIMGYGISIKGMNHTNLRNVYNQLKKIAKSKGDIDTASRFESLEHRKLLFSKTLGFDSILLLLNFISNNNGRSWFQGIVFTVATTFLFFNLYLLVLNIKFTFFECYGDFVLFLSSFPKLELQHYNNLNENWEVQLVLWLARIFISYGIYQTIAAFRKYGKS